MDYRYILDELERYLIQKKDVEGLLLLDSLINDQEEHIDDMEAEFYRRKQERGFDIYE
ncbi:hypothetical protein ABEX78_32400 [Priestia megaterium]